MLPERYNIENLNRIIENPPLLFNEYDYLKETYFDDNIKKKFNKRRFSIEYGSGEDFMEEDWDNLIILDACRYDIFRDTNTIAGDSTEKISNSSNSLEFFRRNFENRNHHDTVYITANGHAYKLTDGIFHDVIFTYDDEYIEAAKSDDLLAPRSYTSQSIRHPSHVCDLALKQYKKYEEKRIIIHFMQPHAPYFGQSAEHLRDFIRSRHDIKFGSWNTHKELSNTDPDDILSHLMAAARKGYVSTKDLHKVYIENLEIVLEQVKQLLKNMDGRTVITADHGELLGNPQSTSMAQNTFWGHPEEVYAPELRVVPWLTIDSGERRNIHSEEPLSQSQPSQNQVNQQLEALGYK